MILSRLSAPIFLVVVVAIGSILRFWNITKSSIWHDEGYTMMLAPNGVLEILWRTGRDVHPPLYYIVLHYWMVLFGSSEVAARSLSAILMIACIPLAYLLVKRLYSESAARLAALFVAIGPFLVRYSQEARMYALVAFLLLLSTYFFVRALEKGSKKRWYVFYAVALAAALYAHYYAVFMIVVHWAYVLFRSNRARREGLFDIKWWLANIGAAALFLPWVPTAMAQLKRVQASFWIPPSNAETLPNTLMQFTVYNNLSELGSAMKLVIALGFLALTAGLMVYAKKQRSATFLLTAYALAGPVLVVAVSILLSRPIYVDRYFVFAAVGLYALLAAILIHGWPFAKQKTLAAISIAALTVLFMIGNLNVYKSSDHQMRKIGDVINSQYTPGDEVVSGELYSFFDYSYYNRTGAQTRLLSSGGVNGYGESSLIFDRSDAIVVHSLSELRPTSGFVWVVGKTGEKDYFNKVPSNWSVAGPKYQYGYSAAQRYAINP